MSKLTFENSIGQIQVWHYKIANCNGRYSLPPTDEIIDQYQLVKVGSGLLDWSFHTLPSAWEDYPIRKIHKIKR